jgi:hypothetical protein
MKQTMADDPHLLATADECEDRIDRGSPIATMPHLEHTAEELDKLHPSLVPPPDDGLQDIDEDERDGVLQTGFRLAEKIREVTQNEGRRKRPLQSTLVARLGPAHGTLSLCAGTTESATTAARTTQPCNSGLERARAERANTAFSNDVTPPSGCNASRVRRLASVGGAWQQRTLASENSRTRTATTILNARPHGPVENRSGCPREAGAPNAHNRVTRIAQQRKHRTTMDGSSRTGRSLDGGVIGDGGSRGVRGADHVRGDDGSDALMRIYTHRLKSDLLLSISVLRSHF